MAISSGTAPALDAGLDAWIEALAGAGVGAVLIREKQLDDLALLALVARAISTADGRIAVLVSGRADIAVAAGAAGVHLPADGVPTAAVRRRFGDALLIGCSTHSLEAVTQARIGGADYVTFGPVWETPAKRRYGAPIGLAVLARAAAIGLPVLGLGGVTARRLTELARAGAFGAAAIRMLQTAPSIAAAAAAALEAWPSPRANGSLGAPRQPTTGRDQPARS